VKRSAFSWACVLAAALCATGCGSPAESTFDSTGASSQDVGSVGLDLRVPGNMSFTSASYDISRGSYHKTGSLDVSNASSLSVLVDGIPVGTGYTVTLDATSTGSPPSTCTGSSTFDVDATTAAIVPVLLSCTTAQVSTGPAPVPLPRESVLVLGLLLLCAGVALPRGAPVPLMRDKR
jgi:hypothetical protein